MAWGVTSRHKFRTRLGFKQYHVILTKQQPVTRIMTSFEGENRQTQYVIVDYRIDLHFHDYRLAIKIDKNGHSDRRIE